MVDELTSRMGVTMTETFRCPACGHSREEKLLDPDKELLDRWDKSQADTPPQPAPAGTTLALLRHIRTYLEGEAFPDKDVLATLAEVERRVKETERERDALLLVHQEARELIGEADATGEIPLTNINALRALLWRASLRKVRTQAGETGE